MRRALSFLLSAAKLAPIPIGLGLAAYFVLLESYAAGPLASVGLALAAACLCLADPAKPYRLQVAAETPDGLAAVAASVLAHARPRPAILAHPGAHARACGGRRVDVLLELQADAAGLDLRA